MNEPRPGGHPEGSGYTRLQELQTLEEILATAMSFEQTARDFYAGLAGQVAKPLRALVEELALEEATHYQLFHDLRERADVQAQIRERIERPPSDHRFSDYIQIPDLGEHPDDQDILRYALGREQAAMEQYRDLAERAPPGPIAELFAYLAYEELRHKQELEKRYYEIVHSGGV